MKGGFPLKVAIGYVFLVLCIGLASWLVYSNMNSLMLISERQQHLLEHRSIADSLICDLMDVNNKEQAITLGLVNEMEEFDASLAHVIMLADMLKQTTEDSLEGLRIDTLKLLLAKKRENTMLISKALGKDESGKYFDNKLSNLSEGKDSIIVHTQAEEKKENTETVYEVVKTKKGFFSRLGDAFKKGHTDTVSVRRDSSKLSVDTIVHNIDVADSVAHVLTDIKAEEKKVRQKGLERLTAQEKSLQMVSIDLASRIADLLDDIRYSEQKAFKEVLDSDINQRKSVSLKILSLALISLLMAIVFFLYIWRDTLREKRYRENLETAKAEIEKIMNQRERLLLTITHDIKAPIASISGFTELIGMQEIDSKASSYLKSIKNSSSRLLRLVSELLDYHRLESGKMEVVMVSFSARRLVNDCVERLLPQAVANEVELSASVEGCPKKMLRGDVLRISQILENLLGNAIKYTSKGSVKVTAKVEDSKLYLSVADTGQGMTQEEASKIFDAFTRLEGAQGIEGVGLGLSITKELVNLLSGSIRLKTHKGKGTEFNVVIPIEVTSSDEILLETQQTLNTDAYKLLSKEGKEVILIDDDDLQLKLLKEMIIKLTDDKWRITTCKDVKQGLNLIATKKFDLLITDIEMPALSGKDLVTKIEQKDLKIIGMTAHEKDIMPSLLNAGFSACLFKPFTLQELAETLSKVTSSELIKLSVAQDKTKVPNRFSSLTAFASGDVEAEREILRCFLTDLMQGVSLAQEAIKTLDRKKLSHFAHKVLPFMTMVEALTVDKLKGLLKENIQNLSDEELLLSVEAIISEMKEMANEVNAFLMV